jgi:replicative DNA helicase
MKINRIKVDSSIEKRILAGLVVSKEFLEKVYPILNLNYFDTPYIKSLVQLASLFYETYSEPPMEHIREMVLGEFRGNDSLDAMLKVVDDILSLYKTGSFNIEYMIDQVISFFKKKELEIIMNNMKIYIDRGDVDKAEQEIVSFHKITKPTFEESDFIFSESAILSVGTNEDDNSLLKMTKDLGKFIGGLNRGWLVGISGPFKRGKSWLLNEFAVIAALSSLRVAYFSLEMSAVDVRKRLYQRLTGTSDNSGLTIFPCFDCKKNQNGSCTNPQRVNKYPFKGEKTGKNYKPCSICRTIEENKKDYEVAIWREEINVPKLSTALVHEKIAALQKIGKVNIWLKTKPRFSAAVKDIEADLDNLEISNSFIPDVIIIDYADILQADDNTLVGVQKEDEVWMALARMATKRNALVITATQLNKDALSAKQISVSHTAKWIGKLAHIDVMLALNQTPEEKAIGLMRMSVIEHRHKRFIETQNCYILQNLSVGQPNLDSYMEDENDNQYFVSNKN